MRIGVDIKAFKNGTTGIARYIRTILDHLQEIDSENEYYLFECWQSDYKPYNSKWKKIYYPWKLPGIVWQQFLLPFQLKKHKIDVLWSPEQVCPLFFTSKKLRIITTIHDIAFIHFPETFQFTTLHIFKYLFPRVIKRSDILVTVSEFIKKDVLHEYKNVADPEKFLATPNGKPDWQIPSDYSSENRQEFLFFAGNLEPRKNLITLIKALELLSKEGLDIPLHLAGPRGWKNSDLHTYIQQSEIKKNILIKGYLTEEELKQEYLTCKALVYPSLYEGFGLPPLEALIMDCLVLTSKNTVMEEVAEDSAIYFDPKNPRSVADSIKKVYCADFNRSAFLKNKDSVLNKYSWEKVTETLLKLFLNP